MTRLSDESYFIYKDTYNSMREIKILTNKQMDKEFVEAD